MAKPKIKYEEKYRAGTMIKADRLPTLRHIDKRYIVKSCELKSAGVLDDGTEFQVLKVILKEGVIS